MNLNINIEIYVTPHIYRRRPCVQSAVMSGLEDVNSSQFFTKSNINNLCGHNLKLYKEHFCKVNEFGSNFHKKCYQRTIK